MTQFEDREKAFEKKFAHDAELKFKAESRRNKALAEWAGARLGLSGADLEDYVKAVRKADLAEKGWYPKAKLEQAEAARRTADAQLSQATASITAQRSQLSSAEVQTHDRFVELLDEFGGSATDFSSV